MAKMNRNTQMEEELRYVFLLGKLWATMQYPNIPRDRMHNSERTFVLKDCLSDMDGLSLSAATRAALRNAVLPF